MLRFPFRAERIEKLHRPVIEIFRVCGFRQAHAEHKHLLFHDIKSGEEDFSRFLVDKLFARHAVQADVFFAYQFRRFRVVAAGEKALAENIELPAVDQRRKLHSHHAVTSFFGFRLEAGNFPLAGFPDFALSRRKNNRKAVFFRAEFVPNPEGFFGRALDAGRFSGFRARERAHRRNVRVFFRLRENGRGENAQQGDSRKDAFFHIQFRILFRLETELTDFILNRLKSLLVWTQLSRKEMCKKNFIKKMKPRIYADKRR